MALNNRQYNPDDLDGDKPSRLQYRFLVLRKLGQGTYGKVQLALNKETNEEVAVKTIKKGKIENEEDMLRIRREIHIMSSLRHPHIIHINEVFETRQKIVIVMQYASGGELYDYLGCHQTLPEDESRRIFRQISSAIYYCHKNQICHRDLKLENILLDEEGNAQIADFGLSNIFDDKRRMNTFCGSPLYASPEIVKGTPYKGPEVDCWSLGVLLYTLVYGTMPFDGRSFKELVTQISEGRYEEPINRSNASSLIRWLLTPDISRRATITDVCKDSWINQGYDTSLLEIAESMALKSKLRLEQINATKMCQLEPNTKNGRDKSNFRKAVTQLEEKAEKFTMFMKNFENILKTNETISQTRRPSIYEQMANYDVRFVLNKLIAAVEASINDEKVYRNTTVKCDTAATQNARKNETIEKVDSAYVIPIFEVTSTIPNKNSIVLNKKSDRIESTISNTSLKSTKPTTHAGSSDQIVHKQDIFSNEWKNIRGSSEIGNNSMHTSDAKNNHSPSDPQQRNQILMQSPNQLYSLNVLGESDLQKSEFQSRKLECDHSIKNNLQSQKAKRLNDGRPFGHKHTGPLLKTKHHVLSLARVLSLNYEKLMRNSFRIQTAKKKLPGKITIPPTFDPNISPTTTKKQQEEKKELLIFPTVSVSENKVKIEKKIEKIKKAALNKNFIIRSDSKTRMRIEKYICSQVKKIQDLVCEEQRSLHASLEHLDEQSLRDMSEMYYCAFGSENTDSGIANTDDDEYFCFLCSKPNVKGTSTLVDSVLESIKKGCLYTSNHLHIPKGKQQYLSSNSNMEFGSLSRCKSEIEFPIEYLNYISPFKLDSNKRNHTQQIQRNNIGNTKYFLTTPSKVEPDNSNLRILRSASDSVGLNLNKNAFEVVKLSTNDYDNANQNYRLFPHLLETTLNGCNYSQMTDYETQSFATDNAFMNTSQMLEKDDGIGDSNDSFQSYIETLENHVENNITISRSMSSHNYINFMGDNSIAKPQSSTKLFQFHSRNNYESDYDKLEKQHSEHSSAIMGNILDSASWMATLNKEHNGFVHQPDKSRGLRRRNTMTCIHDKVERSGNYKYDQSRTEFENYLWNAYKDHLLENSNDTDCSSSPNLNYYSLDRTKFKGHDTKSMDYINGENSNNCIPRNLNILSSVEQNSSEISSTKLKNILKHSNTSKSRVNRSTNHLNRTKSICSETLTDSDRDDIIRRLRDERKLSLGNTVSDTNNDNIHHPFASNFLKDLEKRDQGRKINSDTNQRRFSKSNLPHTKRTKSEYKKSFLQLLALKRIQEAEKELDKAPKNDLLNGEDENSGSLLEALKTHGYKTVISQRFQDTEDDLLDPFHMRYLKSPRNLRAELARLNYMYYESLPRYNLDTYEETDYLYDDLDYSRNMLNTLAAPTFYDMPIDFRKQTPKQSVYDWLDTAQTDEYLSTKRSDSLYIPEETTPTPEMQRCCTQWGNYKSFDDESTSESQDTVEEFPSNGTFNAMSKKREKYNLNEVNSMNYDKSQMSAAIDDERQESVQDRIWRKSFYSRFNNRALSRKERLSYIEPELLSENRLGLLNNIYNPSKHPGFEKSEVLQCDGLNKSFHMKRSKKHSPSLDKFESRNSIKKKYPKSEKEGEFFLGTEESCSNKRFTEVYNTAIENEEPEH